MTMKPQSVAASPAAVPTENLVELKDLAVQPSVHAAKLPGLSLDWRPTPGNVDEVHSTINCLLNQAIECIQHNDELDQVQWAGVQQLAMARQLYDSLMNTIYNLQVVDPAVSIAVEAQP